MKVLFEGMKYKLSDLKEVFGERTYQRWTTRADKSGAYVSCVGYFYNSTEKVQYFVLPKVFIFNGNKVFGIADLRDEKSDKGRLPIIDLDAWKEGRFLLDRWKVDVIHKLPVYVFLAIKRYRDTYQDSINNEEADLLDAAGLEGSSEMTYLEMIMAMEEFYKNNRQLFIYIYKKSHSGTNKIDWVRTAHTQTAFRNGDNFVYPVMINNRKTINFEERLMVIFYSTLRYIQEIYNYPLKYECWYHLDSPSKFRRLAENGMILKELKAIRQNYFRDEMQKLWKLLYNFYDIRSRERADESHNEYLMVKKFDRIFEDMVNELIGDKFDKKDPKYELINQKDDKIVDHLFLYRAIDDYEDKLEHEKVYYIGDSKYYKEGNSPEGSSFFKQYTYARNIIQTEITWMLTKQPNDKYRNDLTEGYKITPNFFILGKVRDKYDFHDAQLEEIIENKQEPDEEFIKNRSRQWPNRLFDRDTLFLEKYYINFLFVLDAYIHADAYKNKKFKEKAKEKFRNDFIAHLNRQYHFYLLRVLPSYELEEAVNLHFKSLNGKIYLPIGDFDKNTQYVLMAFENSQKSQTEEEKTLLIQIRNAFEPIRYKLGEDINEAVAEEHKRKQNHSILVAKSHNEVGIKVAENEAEGNSLLLVGCYKSQKHYDWILNTRSYNVRLGSVTGSVSNLKQRYDAKYLLLYDIEDPNHNELYELLKKHDIKTRAQLIANGYPLEEGKDDDLEYFIYYLKREITDFNPDKEELEQVLKHNEEGKPYYTELSHLIL